MGFIIFLLLVAVILALLPTWPYSRRRGWGYRPTGLIGVVLFVWLLLLFFAVIPWWGYPSG